MKLAILSAALFAASIVGVGAADVGAQTNAVPKTEPTPWDAAFSATVTTDYNFRGISQSARKPSVWASFEPRYNVSKDVQLYLGVGGESIAYPNRAAAEIDLYAGIRPTFGPLALDFGFWYYYYPGGQQFAGTIASPALPNGNVIKSDVSFWELYAKSTYAINEQVTIGGNLFYSPSWLNSGAFGTYAAGTLKITAPSNLLPNGLGAYVSGELGRYWFGVTDAFYAVPAFPAGIKYPDYTTWNVGIGLTWKVLTFDLRYYDTNLSKADCNVLTSDHTATFGGLGAVTPTNPAGLVSNWCGAAFIGKLSIDSTLNK